jgi:tripartite-type tricarboxylate transporter receptor subunit TctC
MLLVISCTLSLLTTAQAADKPIRLVIFAAGGPVDFVARQFAEKLSKTMMTDVIVEAKPGANGIIAAQSVIASEPDGTTLFFASSGLFTISRDSLRAAGVEPAASTPAEFATLVQADRARWATLIKQKQLKME